jgi:CheY-like chemotaxis protein
VQAAAPSVLTVEDNPIVRADLRLILEDAGFAMVGDARDGVEAVELAREHQPDVIVLDLGLPHVDGIEVTQRILAERTVPIVAVTGRSPRLAEEALDAGARSYVLKPIGAAQLVEAVRDALDAHRDDEMRELRARSLSSLESLVDLLGYPTEWAVELERRAWKAGSVWRIADVRKRRRGTGTE